MIHSYRDLEVWQKSMDLVEMCYRVTHNFPKNEVYGLTSQLRRAAISVPANIAEGRQRQHRKEFMQHLSIAYGSLAELETHLELAQRLNYLERFQMDDALDMTNRIGRMINGLKRSLNSKPDPRSLTPDTHV